jgi:hypothetical protein
LAKEPFSAMQSSIWLGALFFYLKSGFKVKMQDVLDAKFNRRNLKAGYLLQVLILCLIILFIVFV